MADESGHREGKGSGAKAGHNHEKDTIIHTKLKDGSLKIYELEKELAPIDAIRVRREYHRDRRPGPHWRMSASSPSMSSAW